MNRLEQLDKQIARLKRRAVVLDEMSHKYWNARRALFVGGLVLALLFCSFAGNAAAWFLAALIAIAFFIVTVFHTRVRESLTRNLLLIEIKQVQIARIRLDWDRIPPADLSISTIPDHPFEIDLDITGERSLHRLLDCAVTKEGSDRLRSWLLSVRPDAQVIKHRQTLVQHLKTRSLFRDKLQLLSAIARLSADGPTRPHTTNWNSRILVDWIERSRPGNSLLPTILLLSALSALNIACIVLASLEIIRQIWPITFLIYVSAMLLMQSRIAPAWGELQGLEKAMTHFKAVFTYLESRSYGATPLAQICAPFLDQGKRPSNEIKRLGRLAAALGLRTNPILWFLVHLIVPWGFIFTHRLELLKKEIAHLLPRWLDAWYELEALNSLANFAYLNSHYAFPEISPGTNQFAARELGHPLLKPESKVCNDFELDDEQRIVILTGSNMAGKSTFLRTIGINVCLAYAGAPVNATHLELSLLRLFSCIKVSDSVQDGLSYFYAEVKRLRALLAAARIDDALSVLFLIDEIFRGTNSRERLIGSRSYIGALSQTTSVGLIATHDFELIKLADEIDGVANLHFREEVHDSRMIFDYRLRTGPCPTTNALTIMRLEGLPVEL